MLDEFIEEIFEVCETAEVKQEKKGKDAVGGGQDERKQCLTNIVRTMEDNLDRIKQKLVSSVHEHGQYILQKNFDS